MEGNNDKIKGIVGTVIFHALLVVALLFLALTTPLPLPEEEGVEVNLGYSDAGMGEIQPDESAAAPVPTPPRESSSPEEEYVTDDQEEVPTITQKPKPKETQAEKPKEQTQNTTKPAEEVKKPEPKPDPKAMYPGKSGKNDGGNQGETGQPGDQGKPTGDKNSSGYDGLGGMGDGVSYSLSGRNASHLPKPSTVFKESGTVVVTIWVDRNGLVVKAIPGARGTTTTSTELTRLAKEAALKARFNAMPNAPEEQKGTITYHFLLKN